MAIDITKPLELADGTKVTYVGTTPRGRIQVYIPGGDNNPYLFEQSGEHYRGEQLNLVNSIDTTPVVTTSYRVNDRYFDTADQAISAALVATPLGGVKVYKVETTKVTTLLASVG